MITDFHTHVFPDNLALKVIPSLAEKGNVKYYSDGTISSQLENMKKWGVDRCVVLSIATNIRQTQKVNDFAISINNNQNIVAFGSVHPFAEDVFEELTRLKKAGIKGIKLHPEYQGVHVLDKKFIETLKMCEALGFIVTIHAGKDIGFPDTLNAPPEALKKLVLECRDLKLVLAHMGGFGMYDEVLAHLCGLDVYFDTSFMANYIDLETAKRIINSHSADRILFGSDLPWEAECDSLNFIDRLNLTSEQREKILEKNADVLLATSF